MIEVRTLRHWLAYPVGCFVALLTISGCRGAEAYLRLVRFEGRYIDGGEAGPWEPLDFSWECDDDGGRGASLEWWFRGAEGLTMR